MSLADFKLEDRFGLQRGDVALSGVQALLRALLDRNPDPTETEIRYALAGNLCRCTGYDKIVRAVQATAKDLRKAKKR